MFPLILLLRRGPSCGEGWAGSRLCNWFAVDDDGSVGAMDEYGDTDDDEAIDDLLDSDPLP